MAYEKILVGKDESVIDKIINLGNAVKDSWIFISTELAEELQYGAGLVIPGNGKIPALEKINFCKKGIELKQTTNNHYSVEKVFDGENIIFEVSDISENVYFFEQEDKEEQNLMITTEEILQSLNL